MIRRAGYDGPMDEKRARTLEEQIAEALRKAHESGELAGTKSFGKPLDFGDGYEETPPELRLAFKVLKDSGFAPPEVSMLQEIAAMRRQLASLDPQGEEAKALVLKIQQMEVEARLRIERLGKTRSL